VRTSERQVALSVSFEMIPKFYILGSQSQRPESRKTIFADGSPDSTFRPGVDLELSHWVPNRTPHMYKADTSTEICMNFIESSSSEGWDIAIELAINNHLDVDGILCVFALIHSKFALAHRKEIVQAAEMGDFWAWGDREAQILFQSVTILMKELAGKKLDAIDIYTRCFEKVFSVVDGGFRVEAAVGPGLQALQQSVELVESRQIRREVIHDRLVHYAIPRVLAENNLSRALNVPEFNAPLSHETLLLPQARARFDREKIHVVSIETQNGWYYDLWYPGYMWADTPNSWRAPGFQQRGETNAYQLSHEPLELAVRRLQETETLAGRWTLPQRFNFQQTVEGRGFPVMLSFLDESKKPIPSELSPSRVISLLSKAFEGA
jgi:hypothetical protein